MIWINTILTLFKTFCSSVLNFIKKFFKWDIENCNWLSPIKTVLIIGLGLIILYMRSCTEINCPTVTGKKSDTVVVTKTDTVWFEKPQTVVGKKPVKKPGGIPVTPNPKSPCDSLFKYTQEFEDTMIKGILTADVKGEFIGSSFTYTPKFPKYITNTETITITNTVTIEVPRKQRPYGLIIGGGVNASHNRSLGLSVDLGVQFKQGFNIIYGFDPIRLNHRIGGYYIFEFNKKK